MFRRCMVIELCTFYGLAREFIRCIYFIVIESMIEDVETSCKKGAFGQMRAG